MSELNAYFRPHSMNADCRELQPQPSQEVVYLRFDNVCYNKHYQELWVLGQQALSGQVRLQLFTHLDKNCWSGTVWKGIGFRLCFNPEIINSFPAARSCKPWGRKGGNREKKTKWWKDWYCIHTGYTGGLVEVLKVKWWAEARARDGMPTWNYTP